MLRILRSMVLGTLLGAAVAAGGATSQAAAQGTDGYHRLALYITEAEMDKMNSVLDVAANVSRHYSAIGEEVEIQIVAYNAGLHMLRADTSPVRKRLENFMLSMVNVSFQACGNTLDSMTRNEGVKPELIEGTEIVQTGVAHLLALDEEGWTLVRP
ncbi:DsrE family protein [Pelagibius marinus]|uniref:DsrE family protein n=1 Tax=Pelagibius marinus TaxID=2762760 RepID=UPI001D04621D|nr:hypothetical protein [Pelagibius marinus]